MTYEYLPVRPDISTYNGGKGASGTHQQIINFIPPHDIYFELFLGRGEIFARKKLADYSIIFDIDIDIYYKWRKVLEIDSFLQNVFIGNFNAIHFLENAWPLINWLCKKNRFGSRNIFIYLDPPYLIETRKSGSYKKLYRYEMSEEDHKRLLSAVLKLNCHVMISHYKCDLYNQYLKGWNTHEFEAQTRKGKSVECIYFNYERPDLLHDYSYIGNNFHERDFLKGQKNRLISKLEKMKPVYRNKLINEILSKFTDLSL